MIYLVNSSIVELFGNKKMDRIEQLLDRRGQAGELFGDFTMQQNNVAENKTEQEQTEENIKEHVKKDSNMNKMEEKKTYICSFCYKNQELYVVYSSHPCKDEFGRTVCPILRSYVCTICGQTGDNAHTKRYCPLNMKHAQNEFRPWFRRLSNGIITTNRNHK